MKTTARKWLYRSTAQVVVATAVGLVLLAATATHRGLALDEPEIVGFAEFHDGDTLSIGDQRIRLEGIDAPELSQNCGYSGRGEIAAGKVSRKALIKIVAAAALRCEPHGRDGYGRILATCRAGTTNINATMVERGHAWAFRKYSDSYVREENAARAGELGIWALECIPAWLYRQTRWIDGASEAPNGCAVKGNISRSGRIYHMPWDTWYARVRIDPERGERWFCSGAEARAAGWRAARN